MNRHTVMLLAVTMLLAGLSSAQEAAPAANAGNQAAQASAAAPVANQEYKIGAEDLLTVSVWREPDMSGAVPVRPDGNVTIALLGDVPAAGMTAAQLSASIEEKLRKYLTDPRVTVVVTEVRSKRVYVIGEVARQGPMTLTAGMRVSQAISSAGGFTQFANTKKILVLRNESGSQHKYKFNYKEFVEGRNTAQDIQLIAGDTVVVP